MEHKILAILMLLGASQCSAQLRGSNSPSPTGGHAPSPTGGHTSSPDFFEVMGAFFVILLSITVFNLIMWKVFSRYQAPAETLWVFGRHCHLIMTRILMYYIPLPMYYVRSRVGEQTLVVTNGDQAATNSATNLITGRGPVVVETQLRWVFRYVPMFAPLETLGIFFYQVIYYFIGLFLCCIIFSVSLMVYIVVSSLILILILPFKHSRNVPTTWAEMFTFPDTISYLAKVRENLSNVEKRSCLGVVFCYFYAEDTA
jgi:hypothetical protein